MNQLYLGAHIDYYEDSNIFESLELCIKNKCNVLQLFLGNKQLTTLSKKVILSKEEITKLELTNNSIVSYPTQKTILDLFEFEASSNSNKTKAKILNE